MNETVRMSDMTSPEFAQALEREPLILLPVGAVEQHGPHLPLGTDYLIPTAICERVAEQTRGVVAPALPYGYKSWTKSGGGPHFPGTINLDGTTLVNQLRDVIRELHRQGVQKICVVDGNVENQFFAYEGIDLAIREIGDPQLNVMWLGHWDFITEDVQSQVLPPGHPGMFFEHAAVVETSLMLYVHPDKVRVDCIPDESAPNLPHYDMFPPRPDWPPKCGVFTSAKTASAEKGELIMSHYVKQISAAVRSEFDIGS